MGYPDWVLEEIQLRKNVLVTHFCSKKSLNPSSINVKKFRPLFFCFLFLRKKSQPGSQRKTMNISFFYFEKVHSSFFLRMKKVLFRHFSLRKFIFLENKQQPFIKPVPQRSLPSIHPGLYADIEIDVALGHTEEYLAAFTYTIKKGETQHSCFYLTLKGKHIACNFEAPRQLYQI